jgi:hypothetical protein
MLYYFSVNIKEKFANNNTRKNMEKDLLIFTQAGPPSSHQLRDTVNFNKFKANAITRQSSICERQETRKRHANVSIAFVSFQHREAGLWCTHDM